MTEVLRPTPTQADLDEWDKDQCTRKSERERLRQIHNSHSRVAEFVLRSTTRVSQTDNSKTLLDLPKTVAGVLQLSDDFGVVAEQALPKFLETVKLTRENLILLHVEVETVASAIDPSRLPHYQHHEIALSA